MQQPEVRPQMSTVDTIKSARTIAQRPVEPVCHDTDEEIVERLRTRFAILDDMTRAVK